MTNPPGGVNLGSAYSSIIIDDNINQAIGQATRQFDSALATIGSRMQAMGRTMSNVGGQLTLATAPLAAFGVNGVRVAAGYEDALTEIQARAGLTAEQLEVVSDKTRQIGLESQFGPAQAADAFLQLLTSGSSVEEAMQQIDAVILGASASGSELGFTADALTDVMAAMRLEASESANVIQTLTNATGSSSATFSELIQGFANIGPMARNMGLSVGETAATLAVFSENGIKGAEAGTQLRSMLNNMARETDDVTGTWNELGVSLFDSQGNMRDLDSIIRDLNGAMDGMSDEERNRVITTLAGSYGQLGLSALLANDGIGDMLDTMEMQSDVASLAESRLSTLNGAFSFLRGSIELLQIEALQPLMDNHLRPLVMWVSSLINRLTEWIQANPELAGRIVQVLAVLTVLGPTLVVVGQAISLVGGAVAGLGILFAGLTSPIGLVAIGLGALVYVFRDDIPAAIQIARGFIESWSSRMEVVFVRIRDAAIPAFREIFTFIQNNTSGLVQFGQTMFNIGRTIYQLTNPIGQVSLALRFFGVDVVGIFESAMSYVAAFFGALNDGESAVGALQVAFGDTALFNGIVSGFSMVSGFVTETVIPAFNTVRYIVSVLRNAFGYFWERIQDGMSVLTALRVGLLEVALIFDLPRAPIVRLTNGINDFADSAGSIWSQIQGSLAAVSNWFLQEGLPAITNFVTEQAVPAIMRFANWLGSIWASVSPSLNAVGGWFVNVGGQIWNILTTQIIPLLGSFMKTLGDIWLVAQPHLAALANWFMFTAVPFIANMITTIILPAISQFVGLLQRLWTDVSPHLTQLFNWFFNTGLPPVIAFLKNVIWPTIENFISLLQDIWELVSPALESFYNWFMESGLPDVLGFIEGTATNAINLFIALISSVMDEVNGAIDGIQDLIDLYNRASEAVSSGAEGVQFATGSGMQQITSGLQSGQFGIGDVMGGFGRAIAAEFRDSGGRGRAGGAYMIGTGAQPELFIPDSPGTFIPNADQLGGGGGVNIQAVHINASSEEGGRAAARGFAAAIMDLKASNG